MNSRSSSIPNRPSVCPRASDQALDSAATRYRPWRRLRSPTTSGSSTMPSHIPASRAASWRSSRSSVSPTQAQNSENDTDPTNAARSMGEPHTLRLKTLGSSPSSRSQRSSRNPVLVLVKTVFPKSNTTASITRHSRAADKSANATTPVAFGSPREWRHGHSSSPDPSRTCQNFCRSASLSADHRRHEAFLIPAAWHFTISDRQLLFADLGRLFLPRLCQGQPRPTDMNEGTYRSRIAEQHIRACDCGGATSGSVSGGNGQGSIEQVRRHARDRQCRSGDWHRVARPDGRSRGGHGRRRGIRWCRDSSGKSPMPSGSRTSPIFRERCDAVSRTLGSSRSMGRGCSSGIAA